MTTSERSSRHLDRPVSAGLSPSRSFFPRLTPESLIKQRRVRWILTGLILACASCGWHPDIALIPDASRPAEMTLHARRAESKIYGLDIEGVADIQGDATIELALNGKGYKTVQLHGHTTFTWSGDWYSPDAIVRYAPASRLTKGSIMLKYRFKTL
jgi:hypothetical protein